MKFRQLRADEIECRVGQFTKDKKRYSVLLYKTARTDMDILDETVGAENWKATHYEVKGKDFCMIEIRIKFEDDSKFDPSGKAFNYEWVGKSDCGAETNVEAEKGESSDAFKRAGFCWGIGRALYSAPKIWLDAEVDSYSLKLESIAYNEKGDISDLVISGKVNGKVQTVYTFHEGKAVVEEIKKEFNGMEVFEKDELIKRIRELGGDEQKICEFYKVPNLEGLTIEQLQKIVKKGESK